MPTKLQLELYLRIKHMTYDLYFAQTRSTKLALLAFFGLSRFDTFQRVYYYGINIKHVQNYLHHAIMHMHFDK